MAKFKLIDLETGEEFEVSGEVFSPGKKFVVKFTVGNLSSSEARDYTAKVRETFLKWLGRDDDDSDILFVPIRFGNEFSIFEVNDES